MVRFYPGWRMRLYHNVTPSEKQVGSYPWRNWETKCNVVVAGILLESADHVGEGGERGSTPV
jgi:hypothetical protein